MEQRIALIGSGGFAKEVVELLRLNNHEVAACYSADQGYFASLHKGYLDELDRDKASFDGAVLAVGAYDRRSLKRRRALIDWLREKGIPTPPLISPTAILAEGTVVQDGAIVGHGAMVGVDSRLGRFSLVNMGAIIGHDAVIGDRAVVAPGAFIGGGSEIGEDTIIGPLAKVLQGVGIGRDVMLGIGCLTLRSLPDGATVWPRPERTT